MCLANVLLRDHNRYYWIAGDPQYGDLLVSMNGGDLDSGGRGIEVATFEDLVKIAEKSGQSILHQTSDGSEHYYVQDIGVSYHYWAPDQEKGTSD